MKSCWKLNVVVGDGDVCDLKKRQDRKNIELELHYNKIIKGLESDLFTVLKLQIPH